MKSRLLGIVSTCFVSLLTTVSSTAVGQSLEGRLPEAPGNSDLGAVPVAVWVVIIGLIGLVGIARRNTTQKDSCCDGGGSRCGNRIHHGAFKHHEISGEITGSGC
ncbi:MAG TPA: hypothetical protein ENK49_14465 [Gammaproteobacteria bacterium]|nr:hypothetical protein [Gammaproteobacteria bacterium]